MAHHKTMADLAMVLAKESKMKVTMTGETSYIDHDGNINIALMPDTPEGRMITTGLVIHETAHSNYSDLKSKPAGMLGTITNMVEDIRVEAKTIKERIGASFTLDAVTTHYASKGAFAPTTIHDAICGKVMAKGRRVMLKQHGLSSVEPLADEIMDDAFGEDFISELDKIIDNISTLTSSDDSIALATAIINLVEAQKEPPQPPSNSQAPAEEQKDGKGKSGGDKGNKDEQEDSEEEQQEGASEDAGSDETSDEGDSEGSETEEADTAPQGAGNSPEDGEDSNPKGAGGRRTTPEEIEDMLNQESDYGDISKLIVNEMDDQHINSGTTPRLPSMSVITRKNRKLDEVQAISASSRMRAKMLGLLQESKRMPKSFGCSGKKLVASKLVNVAFDDARIFSKKKEVKAVNTAVVIAIDYSGSMREHIHISSPAAFAIHNALFGVKGAVVASIAFGYENDEGVREIGMMVDFKVKPTSDRFNLPTPGDTPTDEAIWMARAMLMARPEPRKILLVVTDGHPNSPTETKAASKVAMSAGIEIGAIGIGESANYVSRTWKNSAVVKKIEELPTAMFEIMDSLLLEKKA